MRFALAPRWLGWHLLLVAVLVSFGWLGRWQLGVFEHDDDADVARPAVALEKAARPGGRLGSDDVGRRVHVTGVYDGARTLLAPDRKRPGGDRTGFLVVTPLRTSAGVLPVVRGWTASASAAAVRAPSGTVRLVGSLQASEQSGPLPPGTALPPKQLPYVATVTLLDALRYDPDELYDGYLALRTETPAAGATPVPVEASAATSSRAGFDRWRSLAYALQWWLFAGAAVFFWAAVLRRAARERRAPQLARDADLPPLLAPQRRT